MTALDVRPVFSTADVANGPTADAELLADLLGGDSLVNAYEDRADQIVGQYVVPPLCAPSHSHPFDGIAGVVGMSSEVEVIGSNAGLVVTVVENQLALWNQAKRQHPSHPMSRNELSSVEEHAVAQLPSGPTKARALPFPAALAWGDLRPEPLPEREDYSGWPFGVSLAGAWNKSATVGVIHNGQAMKAPGGVIRIGMTTGFVAQPPLASHVRTITRLFH
jgi:hypothetical protein